MQDFDFGGWEAGSKKLYVPELASIGIPQLDQPLGNTPPYFLQLFASADQTNHSCSARMYLTEEVVNTHIGSGK